MFSLTVGHPSLHCRDVRPSACTPVRLLVVLDGVVEVVQVREAHSAQQKACGFGGFQPQAWSALSVVRVLDARSLLDHGLGYSCGQPVCWTPSTASVLLQ